MAVLHNWSMKAKYGASVVSSVWSLSCTCHLLPHHQNLITQGAENASKRAQHIPLLDGPQQVKLIIGQVSLSKVFFNILIKQIEKMQSSKIFSPEVQCTFFKSKTFFFKNLLKGLNILWWDRDHYLYQTIAAFLLKGPRTVDPELVQQIDISHAYLEFFQIHLSKKSGNDVTHLPLAKK